MTQQTDPANLKNISYDVSGKEIVTFFGCWLDFNQTQPQFPLNPGLNDGPYPVADQVSIKEHIRNEHQCLVAEIAFDPAPIPAGTSPSLSDKLAQRNLAIVESANPGNNSSHRIPHTFEIRPTSLKLGPDQIVDELMLDWGNTPVGSLATFYLPGVDTTEILKLAAKMYRSQMLVRIDSHTLQCQVGGISYIPIPQGEGSNYAGLMSVDLPETVKKSQVFTIVVRQVTSAVRGHMSLTHMSTTGASTTRERRILGSFQLTIPVCTKEKILISEERLLSNLRWIERAIPVNNRWFSVFGRYVRQIASRVDVLGGDSTKVIASPSGEWRKPELQCRILGLTVALLTAVLVIGLGTLTGSTLIGTVILGTVLLIGMAWIWVMHCQPGICQWLRVLFTATGIGAIVLALLMVLGVTAPQLVVFLLASVCLAVGFSIVAWIRHCF